MCYQNYTQYSGCGHYGPIPSNPYTPCSTAFNALLNTRGPSSPPLSPPAEFFPPTRSNTTASKRSSRRFLSMSGVLQRSASTTTDSRRSTSGPDPYVAGPRDAMNPHNIPSHELAHTATSCPNLKPRTIVAAPNATGQVCAECLRWIEAMRSMVAGFDKGRGIKGTPAFKEFLQERDKCVHVAVELGFAMPMANSGGKPRGIMGEFGSGTRTPPEGWTASESDSLCD